MKTGPLRDAERLEELLPEAIRALFPATADDPFSDLPLGQMRVLRLVWRGVQAPTELADELGISASAIAQVLHRLSDAGLVTTVCQSEDRRRKSVQLSPTGRRLMEERKAARASQAARLLSAMSQEERSALLASLEKLVAKKRTEAPTEP
ncbi:MAG: MarR family transcriptional regulator [Armatimonadetes bacterium]|nr:MarR family transcriptional regulator [Armatimonadota bacterium]